MFRLLNKIFCAFAVAPPIYLLFRFLRWYAKQERTQDDTTPGREASAES